MEKSNNMKRILIYGLSNHWGGVEAIVNALVSELENNISFDILISGNNIDTRYLSHKKSVRVLPITAWGQNRKKFISELVNYLHIGQYDYVWVNASLMCNRDIISIVNKKSNSEIITHAHGSYFEERNKIKEYALLFLHYLNRHYYYNNVKHKCACSLSAATWFYGKRFLNNHNVCIIKNGIDTTKFRFNEQLRQQYRTQFNITDEVLLFHAGRLTEVKNQIFLIEIVKEAILYGLNLKLLIAGDGELKEPLQHKIDEFKLNDKVKLLGSRSDVDKLYQAADVFLLPSHHEGFPVTLTEAQTSGLPCIVSDNISKETNINQLVFYLPISDNSIPKWVSIIKELGAKKIDRQKQGNVVIEHGYEIKDVANNFRHILGF